MYTSFFQLERNPFEISPDPYFLYPTAQHQEAVAGLYYGVKARKGFMVLTGEVGTGKTLVVRCLLDLLDQNRVAYAYVFNSRLSSRQFLQYVAEDLGISHHAASKSDLLIRSSRHLIERHREGLTTMLVVDEAQHLSKTVLEEIRLLTNLETPQGKLLQIMLVGQPELDAKLESWDMRQLKQRVTLRFRLHPLTEIEAQGYIQRRLELAGHQGNGIFPEAAVQRVYQYSKGIPRLINTLCDNAMISAYSLGQPFVSPELVDEAAADLCFHQSNGNSGRGRAAATGQSDGQQKKRRGTPAVQPDVPLTETEALAGDAFPAAETAETEALTDDASPETPELQFQERT